MRTGFQITLPNSCTVSVQFGWGAHCDNYDDESGIKEHCRNAEIAVIAPNGELILDPKDGEPYQSYQTVSDFVKTVNWAKTLRKEEANAMTKRPARDEGED